MTTWHNITKSTEPVVEHDGHEVTVVRKEEPEGGRTVFRVHCLTDGMAFLSWEEELRWA